MTSNVIVIPVLQTFQVLFEANVLGVVAECTRGLKRCVFDALSAGNAKPDRIAYVKSSNLAGHSNQERSPYEKRAAHRCLDENVGCDLVKTRIALNSHEWRLEPSTFSPSLRSLILAYPICQSSYLTRFPRYGWPIGATASATADLPTRRYAPTLPSTCTCSCRAVTSSVIRRKLKTSCLKPNGMS
jgi:hypothetical protein